jgi:hypothetical protein
MIVGIAPVAGAVPPPERLARMPALIANARKLYLTGAPTIAGTDAGIAPIKPPT